MSTTGPYPSALFIAGSMPTAAQLNQLARAVNSMQGLALSGDGERPQAFIYQTVAQSLANATASPVLFDAELMDTAVGHSTTVNTSRWTCPTWAVGWFDLVANPVWASNATGYRQATIRKNGTDTIVIGQTNAVNGNTTSFTLGQKAELVPGDYIELLMFQNSGGALNTSPSLPLTLTVTQTRMQ